MPNLIEVQKNSYEWFLDEGLKEVLDDISRRLNREAHHVVLNDFINVALQLIRRAIAVRSKERSVHAPKLIVLQKLLAESSSIDGFPIPPRGLSPISTNLSKAGSEKREKVKEWDLKKRSGKRSEPDYSRPSTG